MARPGDGGEVTVFRFEDHPFWVFSLKVYGNQGVPAACIALQERRASDVNLLLFCTWIGESGRGVLSESELEAARAAVETWNREIVCALRAVRNRLKGGMRPIPKDRSDVLREMILEIEVKSEHIEQIALTAVVTRPGNPALAVERRGKDAVANIAAYFFRLGFTLDAEDARKIALVLDPAFPGIGRPKLEEICRAAGAAPRRARPSKGTSGAN